MSLPPVPIEFEGPNGNVFFILGAACRHLRAAGGRPGEMASRVAGASSYEEALAIMSEYVELIPVNLAVTEDPPVLAAARKRAKIRRAVYNGTAKPKF